MDDLHLLTPLISLLDASHLHCIRTFNPLIICWEWLLLLWLSTFPFDIRVSELVTRKSKLFYYPYLNQRSYHKGFVSSAEDIVAAHNSKGSDMIKVSQSYAIKFRADGNFLLSDPILSCSPILLLPVFTFVWNFSQSQYTPYAFPTQI